MKILLTGAAGFLGSHLAERLLAEGHSVAGLDNFDPYYDPAIKRRNVATALRDYGGSGSSKPAYRLVEGEYGDRRLLDRLLPEGNFDSVIHLAAQAGVRPSIQDPLRYLQINVTQLISLLEALRQHGPRHIVAASSSSVYGNLTPVPFREDAPCLQPQSPYGASKRSAEIYLGLYARLYRFRAVIVRPFTIYGPRQRPDMAIASFARKILAGEPITLYGDGSTSRDYTYVSDIVDGLCAALRSPIEFGVYNLGGEHPVTLRELVTALEKVTGRQAILRQESLPAGDVERTSADLTLARRDLGYSPRVSLEEGLRRTVEWVKQELEQRSPTCPGPSKAS